MRRDSVEDLKCDRRSEQGSVLSAVDAALIVEARRQTVLHQLLESFLDFFAAFFSFGLRAGFFLSSLLLFCSLLMTFTLTD